MARISTYGLDSTPSLSDKWIGTDSATNSTKNFSVESIVDLLNDNSLIDQFDGVIYEYKTLDAELDPTGIIAITETGNAVTAFSAVTQIFLSVKQASGDNVANYIQAFNEHYIKINQQGNLNNFGIFQVNEIQDYNSNYKKLLVNFIEGNGSIHSQERYFVSNYQSIIDKDFSDDSVTEFGDVTSAGSGQIITNTERSNYNEIHVNGLRHSDVIDDLVSNNNDVPLSANQGLVLKGLIDDINTLLLSDNVDLDSLQEVVDFIEANRDTLESLAISNIAGLQSALDSKVDKITGKQLSEEDFTTILKTKLDGIEAEAEVNVQSDWNTGITTEDSYIKNKPTDVTDLSLHSVTETNDVFDQGSGYIITDAERTRIEDELVEKTQTVQIQGTNDEVSVSPATPQALSGNLSFTVGLPDDVTVTNDLTVGNNVDATGNITATGDVIGDDLEAQNLIRINNSQSTPPADLDNGIYIRQSGGHEEMHFRYHGHDLSLSTITEELSTGILKGGELSVANTTQFTIQAGTGIIVNLRKTSTTEPYPDVDYVSWNTQTITITNLDSNDDAQLNAWIYIDGSGNILQQADPFTDAQYRNYITIGSVIHSAGAARFARTFPAVAYGNTTQFNQFIRLFGPLKREGHIISPNGINLSLDRSAGTAFALGRNYASNPNAPSDIIDGAKTQCVIHRYYQDGSGGFIKDDGPTGQGYTTIDPTKFDNGSGTLANMPNNKYSIQRIYYFPSTPDILVVYYGRGYYDNKDVGERSIFLEEFKEADNTSQQAIHVATLLVKKETTDLTVEADAFIYQAGLFRNLSATFSGGVDVNAGLNDLADVSVTSPEEGQALVYDSVNQVWTNGAGSGGDNMEAVYHLVGLSDMYYAQNL